MNLADIEMKLGIIVYNNDLQIKIECRCYQSKLDRVMGCWTQNFHENFCFPDILFLINFADIGIKLGMIVNNNELQIKFEFRH